MNIKYLLLAAGLATAGTALAGDPAPQATASGPALKAVSYTHLDVYKRQTTDYQRG